MNIMTTSKKVILLSIFLSIIYWVIETSIEYFFFGNNNSFLNTLLFGISSQELFHRLFVVILLLLIGYILSRIIDQRDKNFQDLKKSSQNLRITLLSIGEGVITTDEKLKIVNMNHIAEELTGWKFAEARGNSINQVFKVIDEKTGIILESLAKKVFDEGKSFSLSSSCALESKDGSKRSIAESGSPIRESDGRILGTIIVFRDVTEERNNQLKIQASEERFSSIINHTKDGIHLIDESGKIIEWNKSLEKIIGLSKNEVLGKYNWDVQFQFVQEDKKTTEHYEYLRNKTLEVLRTGKSDWINKSIQVKTKKDGQEFYLEQFAFSIARPNGYWMASMVRDITEQMIAIEKVRISEDKLNKIFSLSPDAIIIFKKENMEIVEVNNAFVEIFGYYKEECIYKSIFEINLVEDLNKYELIFNELNKEGHIINKDLDFIANYNQKINGLISATVIDINDEKCVIFYIKDITQLKRIEKEIIEYNVELEERIKERTIEIESTNIELAQINDMLINQANERLAMESALIESEKKYRTLIEQLPVGVYRTTIDGKILQANNALAQILGFSNIEDLKNYNAKNFYSNENDRDVYIKRSMDTPDVVYSEFSLKKLDGKRIWIRDYSKAIFDESGNIVYFDGIIEDFTESKISQDELKESERRYSLLFRNLQDIYFRLSANGEFLETSPSIFNTLGYRRSELLGKKIDDYLVDRSDRIKLENMLQKSARLNNFVFPIYDINNKIIYLSANVHFSYDRDKKLIGIEGIARNITGEIQNRKFMNAIYSISKAVNSTDSLDELYLSIHESLKEIIDTKNFFIAIYDKVKQSISFPYFIDEVDEYVEEISYFAPNSYTARVIRTGKPVLMKEKEILDNIKEEGQHIGEVSKNWLGVPLKIKDEVIGAIAVQSYTNPDLYTEDDIALLQSVSDQIATAIDRKRALVSLNMQLELLQDLIDTIPNPVYYKDASKRLFVICNKAYQDFTGVNKSDIIGKNIYEIYDQNFARENDYYDQLAIIYRQTQKYEMAMPDKDGILKNVVFYKSAFYSEDGEPRGIVGVMVDISDMKKAAEEIKQAREYAELINKVTPSCTFTISKNHTITSWNERIAQVTGYSAEEAIGNKCNLLSNSEICGNCSLYAFNIDEPIYGKESKITTKSGEERIISKNVDLLRDSKGNIIGGIESFEDITERKKAEEALFWESEINSAMADMSKSILSLEALEEIAKLLLDYARRLTYSKFGYIVLVEKETEYMKVIALTEEVPYPDFEITNDLVFKEYRGLWGLSLIERKPLLINNAKEEPRSVGVPDGHIEIKRIISAPAIAGGQLLGQITLANSENFYNEQDILVVERIASLFALSIQRISAEVEIKQALQKELELNELKSRFISMVSHEYRTPLTAIVLSTELLSDYADKLTQESRGKYFDRIRQSVQLMNNLLDDIIIYNKASVGRIEFKPEPVNIEQLCLNITREMQYLAKGKAIIDLTINNGNIEAKIDEKLVRQILINLISNAIKFSISDSIINFEVSVNEDNVEFKIIDFGIGIPDKDKPNIFEPFYRGNNIGTSSGTGLGLAIVQNSVEAHNGKIEFESKENEGTQFIVTIPF